MCTSNACNFTRQLTVTLSNPTLGSLYSVLDCIRDVAHNFQRYIKNFSPFIDFIIKYLDCLHHLTLCCWNFRYNNCIIEIQPYDMDEYTHINKLQCSYSCCFTLCFKSKHTPRSSQNLVFKAAAYLCQKHSANELIITRFTLNAQSILPHAGNKCYEAKIEESEKATSHRESSQHCSLHSHRVRSMLTGWADDGCAISSCIWVLSELITTHIAIWEMCWLVL